jgi:hypothetical protein
MNFSGGAMRIEPAVRGTLALWDPSGNFTSIESCCSCTSTRIEISGANGNAVREGVSVGS